MKIGYFSFMWNRKENKVVKNNHIDKSAVCTAFVCSMAAFACGISFGLALLSSGGSCYIVVENFWRSTRGYMWWQQLKQIVGGQLLEGVQIAFLMITLFVCLVLLIKAVGSLGCKANVTAQPHDEPQKTAFEERPQPKIAVAPLFADETEVSSVINRCRYSSDVDDWQKLNGFDAKVLARYLKNEYPQVAAIVLSKLNAKLSADVLALLPSSFAAEVIASMLNSRPIDASLIGTIGKAVAENIEKSKEKDSVQLVQDIFRHISVEKETQIMAMLECRNPETLTVLREQSIGFEDMCFLLPSEVESLVAQIGEPKLVIALRGASENLRNHFFASMPSHQAKILRETLQRLGPIRLRDIEKAQQEIVEIGRKLYADVLRSRKNG